MAGDVAIDLSVQREVERLHKFFDDWFAGRGARQLSEFADSLDDSFYIVSPGGVRATKSEVVSAVEANMAGGDVRIAIDNFEFVQNVRGMALAVYEEHQDRAGTRHVRLSSVGMVADSATPGGYRWLFVHETSVAPGVGEPSS